MKKLDKIARTNLLSIFIIGIFLILEALILEHYGVNFNIKVNFTSTTIAALATLVIASVGVFTLCEMKKQRESAYKPDLILRKSEFYIYLMKSDDDSLHIGFSNFLPQKDEILNAGIKTIRKVTIPCHNIGLAPAKSIKFNWEFDVTNILEEIKKLDIDNIFKFRLTEDNVLKIRHHNKLYELYLGGNIAFDYSLPINIDKESLKLPISERYLYLLSILFFLRLKPGNLYFKYLPLKLNLDYWDIGNKKHEKKFNIQFVHSYLSLPRELYQELNKLTDEDITKMIELLTGFGDKLSDLYSGTPIGEDSSPVMTFNEDKLIVIKIKIEAKEI